MTELKQAIIALLDEYQSALHSNAGHQADKLLALFEKTCLEIIGDDILVEHWAKTKDQKLAMTTANQVREEQRANLAKLLAEGEVT